MGKNSSSFLVTIILSVFFCVYCDLVTTLEIVSREKWHSRPPKAIEIMKNPVPFVIIHHSYIPPACNTTSQCIEAMQEMQIFHQDDRHWNDIGYSFGVGGDGKAYFGRGWQRVGAHAPKYNGRSIGICVIGDWRYELPPRNQIETIKDLIAYGVAQGHIKENYHLLGHRQVRSTECPGERLYQEIQTWDNYCPNPHNCTAYTNNLINILSI